MCPTLCDRVPRHLSERLVTTKYDVAAVLSFNSKAHLAKSCDANPPRDPRQTWSYGKQNRVKPLWWDRQAIFLKSEDVTFDGLADFALPLP